MRSYRSIVPILLAVAVIAVIGCASPQSPAASDPRGVGEQKLTAPRRITAVMSGDPHTLYQKLNTNNAVRGIVAVERLVSAGLVVERNDGTLAPQIAEAVPTVDNGLWTVLPDGRMETVWKINPNARWHDLTPLTSEDLAFTAAVVQNAELPIFGHIAFRSLEAVELPDPYTVRVKWHRPYIQADRMFSHTFALPLPRHLLEKPYTDDRSSFLELPYWTQEFVGSGPFKLRQWSVGSHLVLEANDQYVLGRPRIDEIEVKFILDSNTIMANILAGSIDVTLDRTLSVEQAIQLRDSWNGTILAEGRQSGMNLWPQLLTPHPPIIGDVRFRRALLHAIDRQQMADVLMAGFSTIFHSWLGPYEPEYRRLEHLIVKYEYDPRKATQMIEELGYARGPDGFFRDGADQKLSVEARTISLDINQKALFAVTDSWQRIGVGAEPVVVPTARQSDREYRATFPGFDLLRGAARVEQLDWLHSAGARLPENDFRGRGAGNNYARYMNPELDALIERFYSTIPRGERMQSAGQIVHMMTDQLLVLTLFYDSVPVLASRRLENVTSGLPWNVHEWTVS